METPQPSHADELADGKRFAFGANWRRFLDAVDDRRIAEAQGAIVDMLDMADLGGMQFLDIGCGSGLSSLVARRLGARVHAFDYDPASVACARELKRRYAAADREWRIEEGSALDGTYLASLGDFDLVYSWGVLHHTGAMWQALENAAVPVVDGGRLFVAIYNDQGWISGYWRAVKRMYNRFALLRPLVVAFHAPYLFGARWLVRALTGRLALERGMSLWHDMIDWLGGYPFEVATSNAIIDFYREQGFTPLRVKTCGNRHGCNEFVFLRERRVD